MHRDISDGNIVIYENPDDPKASARGLLIDWDLCRYKEELDAKPRQNGRSVRVSVLTSASDQMTLTIHNFQGTWRYLSGVLLKYPLKANTVADDIESFYHVLSLFALRFHKHEQTGLPDRIKKTLDLYDEAHYEEGFWVGSSWKTDRIQLGRLPAPLTKRDAFSRLMDSLAAICKSHYEALDERDLKRRFAVSNKDDDDSTQEDEPVTSGFRMPLAIFDDPFDDEDAGKPTACNDNSVDADKNHIFDEVASHHGSEMRPTEQPLASTVSRPAGSSSPALPTAPPLPSSSSSSEPPPLPLDSHTAFHDVFYDALVRNPVGWASKDKLDDQFENIDWSSHGPSLKRGTKRTHDSTYGNVSVSLSHLNSRADSEQGVQVEEEEEDEMPATKRLNTGTYIPRYDLRSRSQNSASSGSGQV